MAEAQFNVQRNNDGCYANINVTTIFYEETISGIVFPVIVLSSALVGKTTAISKIGFLMFSTILHIWGRGASFTHSHQFD